MEYNPIEVATSHPELFQLAIESHCNAVVSEHNQNAPATFPRISDVDRKFKDISDGLQHSYMISYSPHRFQIQSGTIQNGWEL